MQADSVHVSVSLISTASLTCVIDCGMKDRGRTYVTIGCVEGGGCVCRNDICEWVVGELGAVKVFGAITGVDVVCGLRVVRAGV
ncbi:hypothetical protein BDU57DRAFT_52189 [Ampelomyces quisqualis]|uniref:Uncharacterized protein n=1 Tax=Ampelomyces quisqualis TaxID=50730 RepID=A0A6A5R6J7_AMPQU|nr:hypothetical protein BDU57DRAFT_52189 [Ampelomyces quisqualis]